MISTRASEFLIVGGGPAGASAAIALATFGRKVVVVERSDYSGCRFGETLPPAANPVLDRLGLDRAALDNCGIRCPGTVSAWGGDSPYRNDALFDPAGDGLHLDRAAFDRLLAGRAAVCGVKLWTGCLVRSCRRIGNAWHVFVSRPDGHHKVVAANLIDASGRTPWPGRLSHRSTFDRQVAVVACFELDEATNIDRWTWVESAPCGWWYSAFLPGGRYVAAYFTDADLLAAPAGSRERRFNELLGQTHWTRRQACGARSLESLRVVPASSTLATPIVGDGWVAVGDAASTIDPLSSHGILYAITSGLNAAAALLAPDREAALARYAQEITAQFHDDLATRAQFYQRERRWLDSPYWHRRMGQAG